MNDDTYDTSEISHVIMGQHELLHQPEFRNKLRADPKAMVRELSDQALAEFESAITEGFDGQEMPDSDLGDIEFKVVTSPKGVLYIPMPPMIEKLSANQLAGIQASGSASSASTVSTVGTASTYSSTGTATSTVSSVGSIGSAGSFGSIGSGGSAS